MIISPSSSRWQLSRANAAEAIAAEAARGRGRRLGATGLTAVCLEHVLAVKAFASDSISNVREEVPQSNRPCQVAAADDADSPKDAVLSLLAELAHGPSPPLAAAALKAELGALRISQLKQRAAEAGATAAQLDDVDDADAPRDAAISLISELEQAVALLELEQMNNV